MSAALKARVLKLEARHKAAADKPTGFIGGEYGRLIPSIEKPGHLMFSQPPGGFAEYARKQQSELQAELLRLFADDAPQPQGIPVIVGTEPLAPLPKNKKRARYIEVNGVELDALALRGNRN